MKALNWVWGRVAGTEGEEKYTFERKAESTTRTLPQKAAFPLGKEEVLYELMTGCPQDTLRSSKQIIRGKKPCKFQWIWNHSKIKLSHKGKHHSRKIHSAEACLTQIEALLPDDPADLFCAALVLSWSLSHICCIPHLASYFVPTQIRSENHTEREGNCLYQTTMSSATPQLVKQREGFRQTPVNMPTLENSLRINITGIWTYTWATLPHSLCRGGRRTVPWRSTN